MNMSLIILYYSYLVMMTSLRVSESAEKSMVELGLTMMLLSKDKVRLHWRPSISVLKSAVRDSSPEAEYYTLLTS